MYVALSKTGILNCLTFIGIFSHYKINVETFSSLKHPFITIFLCVKCFNRMFEDILCVLLNKKPVFKTKCKIGPPPPPPPQKKKSICGSDFETFPNIQNPPDSQE